MRMKMLRTAAILWATMFGRGPCPLMLAADVPPSAELPAVSFEREVWPILRARCQGCHQPAKAMGGVDLTTAAGILGQSESGLTVVTPRDPAASELLAQITPDENGDALMPQEGPPLSAEQVALVRRWIEAGAEVDLPKRSHFSVESPPIYTTPATISALDISPDGDLIAVSGINETLLLDAAAAQRGKRIVARRLIGLASRIESVRFSPDGTQLAVTGGLPGELGELQVWKLADGELLYSHTETTDTLGGVAWSPDGKQLTFGGADTNVRCLDATTGNQVSEQGAHSDWVLDAAFSTDGKFIASASRDQTIKLIEAATGRLVENITAVSPGVPGGQIFAIARHPRLDMVATGGSEGVPRIYMLHRQVIRRIGDDSNLVRAFPTMPGRVFAVAFNPDGSRLAAASSDSDRGHVHIFAAPGEMNPPEDIKAIQGKVSTERTADEAAKLDEYNHRGAVRLAYAATPMPPIYAIGFLPDGQTIISGGADGVLRFHRVADGTPLAEVGAFELTPVPSPASVAEVSAAASSAPIEFLTDVMPVLGKLGCNAGTCHGARAGQNGFQLSLRGYDPLGDHRALTDDLSGRRINRADPDASLMLLKATGMVPHGGNQVVEAGDRRYEILRRWIAEGAQYNAAAPRVVSISLSPQNPVVNMPGETVAMKVLARYSDGSERDVSADAFIESGDTECATADAAGTITAIRRGEAAMLARYEGSYAATTLTVMGDRGGFEWSQAPVYSRIDELVDVKLQRMKIAASPLCSDEEFLRRIHLDLTGLPPTAAQFREFLADSRPSREKREAVIDQLIGSEDYVEHWANRWADLLMVNGKFLGEGAPTYRDWIRKAIAENRPYDQFVRELFTSTGSNREHPGGSYFKVLRTPDMIAETSSQVFLGVRFNCNKCHDHPFEKWTQDNYYQWSAFFADMRLQKDPESGNRVIAGSAVEAAQPLFEIVDDGADGEVLHLRTSKPANARFPFPAGGLLDGIADDSSNTLRQQAAHWLTSPDNPYFASSYANRVWAHLTGAGLIEPIDDIRAGNPPTNPELLSWLTEQFVDSGFNVQELIRTICKSRTYQLSVETNRWNEDDRRNYSHALPRRLPAEALYDAVHRVVGSTSKFPGVPAGTRAAALPDSMIEVESGLLSKLGRPARESGCECERSSDLQLGPVMALLNGPTFAEAIDDPESELAKLEAATPDDGKLIEEVFVRVLGRMPRHEELESARQLIANPGLERPVAAETLSAWAAKLEEGFEAWRASNRPIEWHTLKPLEAKTNIDAQLAIEPDNSLFASGALAKGVYVVAAELPRGKATGLRLEVLADDRLPARGPGRAPNGNFVISQLRVFNAPAGDTNARRRMKIRSAVADINQPGYDIRGAIDGNAKSGWAIAPGIGADHSAIFTFARPIMSRKKAPIQLIVEIDQQFEDVQHMLGKFRLSVTADPTPNFRPEHAEQWRSLLVAESLSESERQSLLEYYYSQDERYRELQHAQRLLENPRRTAVQDLAWALINSPAFLFNH